MNADTENVGAELERLRRENAELRSRAESAEAASPIARSAHRRAIASVLLIILGSAMLPISVLTIWTRNQVLDTDRYVDTVAPLASDPVIQSALANRIAQKVSDEADIKSRAQEVLPPNAAFLAAPIASGADSLIHTAATKVVQSKQFEKLWINANRKGHVGLVNALTGKKGEIIATKDGKAVLELGGAVEAVLKRVDARFGLDLASKIPAERLNTTFVLVDSKQLVDVQTGVRVLDRLSWFSLILALGFLIGGVAVGPDRRKATVRVGIGVAISMLLLFLGFGIGRNVYLTNLPTGVERPDAAAVIFDTLTRFVLQAVRVIFAIGVVLMLGAWLVGPGRGARRVRGYWDSLLGRGSSAAGSAVDLGPVPAWFARHVAALRAVIIAAAVVVLLAWGRPTGKVVLLIAVLTLIPLAVVQLLAGIDTSSRTEPEQRTASGTEPEQESDQDHQLTGS